MLLFMDLSFVVVVVAALLVAGLAATLGVVVGRAQGGRASVQDQAELAAGKRDIDSLNDRLLSMQQDLQVRLTEERALADRRLEEVRWAADDVLAGFKTEAAERLSHERDAHIERARHRETELEARFIEQERKSAADADAEDQSRQVEIRVAEIRDAHASAIETLKADQAKRDAAHLANLEEAKSAAVTALAAERARAVEQLNEMREDHRRLANDFEALSRKALDANSKVFLEQAEERLKRAQAEGTAELSKREEAVRQLIEPISTTLDGVKSEVLNAEKSRAEAAAALSEQLIGIRSSSDALNVETRNLVNALRAPHVRGRWGELQLRRVVEASGMIKHVDFVEQEHHSSDDGSLRPDLVVHLAGRKRIVVDSKVAFGGYLEAMEAVDDAARNTKLALHARHLRKHIDDLGSKEYWDAVPGSPEFVVLFVPAEPFLTAALEQDPTLFEHAFGRNVVLATPSTLVALLRTVGHVWRQDQLATEAHQIFEVGKELHKRLGVLGGHLATLGKRLNSTVDAYNKFSGSLDRNVITQARRFSTLQGLEPVLESTEPIESLATAPQKEDLYVVSEAEVVIELSGTGDDLGELTER